MMKIDDLLQYVSLELPGVLDLIIVQAFLLTAGDFCTRTLVWDEIQDPIPLVDGVSQYDMDAPTGARVLTIAQVWADQYELKPVTLQALAQALPTWQTLTAPQPRFYNAAKDWSALTVYPTPLASNGVLLTFRAQYAPTMTATTLPDFLAARFLDALCAGVKARLMAQVNVPWSNPSMSLYHRDIYEAELLAARITQLHDRVPSALVVTPRRFG